MSIKTTIGADGVVEEVGNGAVVVPNTANLGISPYTLNVTACTALTTSITVGGVYTVSSSGSGAKQIQFPTAASVPGAIFIVRAASADAHSITSSAGESQGARVFCAVSGSTLGGASPVLSGSEYILAGNDGAIGTGQIGNSVAFICDGVNFCRMAGSGSWLFKGV